MPGQFSPNGPWDPAKEYLGQYNDPNKLNPIPIFGLHERPVVGTVPPVPGTQPAINPVFPAGQTRYSQTQSQSTGQSYRTEGANTPPKPVFDYDNTDILSEIFKREVPKPISNEDNVRRLKTRGALDAFGRMFMNVGDSATLAAGGSPVLRGKSETDQWIDKYYAQLASDREKMDRWNAEEYLRKLHAGTALTNQKNTDRNFRLSEYEKDRDFNAINNTQSNNNSTSRSYDPFDSQRGNQKEPDGIEVEMTANGRNYKYTIPKKEINVLSYKAMSDPKFLKENPRFMRQVATKVTNPDGTVETQYENVPNTSIPDEEYARAYEEWRMKDPAIVPISQMEVPSSQPQYVRPKLESGQIKEIERLKGIKNGNNEGRVQAYNKLRGYGFSPDDANLYLNGNQSFPANQSPSNVAQPTEQPTNTIDWNQYKRK